MYLQIATFIYASAALPTARIPNPPKLITANDVTRGKPDPQPYLMGAKALGVDAKDCESRVRPYSSELIHVKRHRN